MAYRYVERCEVVNRTVWVADACGKFQVVAFRFFQYYTDKRTVFIVVGVDIILEVGFSESVVEKRGTVRADDIDVHSVVVIARYAIGGQWQ